MSRSRISLGIVILASGLFCFGAVPAMAQSNQGSGNGPAATSQSSNAPSGTLVKSHNDWRSSELVGATVYNDDGNSVGTINDLLVSSDGTISNAILSVGGFLGIGTKLIEVPFNKLKLVPSESNSASGPAGNGGAGNAPSAATTPATGPGTSPAANGSGTAPSATPPAATSMARQPEFSVTLPGATKDSLKSDPEFKFAD